ncbi:cysteine-rich CWC family protein [Maribacter polysiphoniae]|uniref:Cysteine-rich CWC n=1 Tax=Maribacter polysiphoniae TaxID=429344 RepID=A0A316DVH6_9FLAO|nr:cysteine-rich CWC family protein [Maribacter polysiphoniae]MBD1262736.1 cysteine-rich CWC family protein [Maribacter polysiphoniae]PWK21975.1 Cysteine-rich CWC [Maribacter polysiphoniae]
MNKHEEKNCPRCNTVFECKVGSILLCQCTTVTLNEEERTYMREQFSDCLCAPCMQAVKAEYHNNLLKDKIDKLAGKSKGL